MIEVDTAADATRSRRRTWITGGVLFVASALLELAPPELAFGMSFGLSTVLFAVGAGVFAIGLGRPGSVTARRPLGTSAVIALAVWQLLSGPLFTAVSAMLLAGSSPMDMSGFGRDLGLVTMLTTSMDVITLALTIVATVQIARIAVVPRPFNRAPLWALIAVVFAQLVPNAIAVAGSIDDQEQLSALFALIPLITAAAVAFLGVVAIVLAVRPAGGETVVFASPG